MGRQAPIRIDFLRGKRQHVLGRRGVAEAQKRADEKPGVGDELLDIDIGGYHEENWTVERSCRDEIRRRGLGQAGDR